MRILSKHKDYYDYLVGVYGMDEIMFYDRRTTKILRPEDIGYVTDRYGNIEPYKVHELYICGKIYRTYEYNGNFYHLPEELVEMNRTLKKDKKSLLWFNYKEFHWKRWNWKDDDEDEYHSLEDARKHYEYIHKRTAGVNKLLRQPVLMKWKGGQFHLPEEKGKLEYTIPDLQSFGVPKHIPAEHIWQDIYSFISWTKDHPEIPNNQTDDEKVQSHGFDQKSFRNTGGRIKKKKNKKP